MNMKKIIMVLISMALVFTMAGAVSADNTEVSFSESVDGIQAPYGSTTVKIQEGHLGASVVISFPNTVYLTGSSGQRLTGTANISVISAVFNNCDSIDIAVHSTNGWTLNSEEIDEYVTYGMYLGTSTGGEKIDEEYDPILTITPDTALTHTQEYTFMTDETITTSFASELSDTLMFMVKYNYEESTE